MAYTSTQRRPAGTSAPGDGSRTITITGAPPGEEDRDAGGPSSNPENSIVGALRLTGGTRRSRPRVAWDEGVVDNEGCGRKSSKICCIYHKPKRFDESSDEDSSDSDSDSDSDSSCDDGRARRSHQHQHHNHSHHRPSDDGAGAGAVRDPGSSAVTQLEEPSRHNTYETVPYGKKAASGKGKRKSG